MSNEPKHTPAPWVAGRPDMATIIDGYDTKFVYADDPKKRTVVAIASGEEIDDWDTVMANAHLIAAAPGMYAALARLEAFCDEWIIPTFDSQDELEQSLSDARAALAKARGGGVEHARADADDDNRDPDRVDTDPQSIDDIETGGAQ